MEKGRGVLSPRGAARGSAVGSLAQVGRKTALLSGSDWRRRRSACGSCQQSRRCLEAVGQPTMGTGPRNPGATGGNRDGYRSAIAHDSDGAWCRPQKVLLSPMSAFRSATDVDAPIYCTSADDSRRTGRAQETSEALHRTIKICALLGSYVYISASHVYESEATWEVLRSDPQLLESGLVRVGLRDDCRDFSDFVESVGFGPRTGPTRSVPSDEITRLLDSHLSRAKRWKVASEQPHLRTSILMMLDDDSSMMRSRLRNVDGSRLKRLRASVEKLSVEEMGRSSLEQLARNSLPSNRVASFMREVHLLYYTIGALDLGLRLELGDRLFTDAKLAGKRLGRRQAGSQDLAAWMDSVLQGMRLPVSVVDELTADRISSLIRDEPGVVFQFRKRWWSVRDAAVQSHAVKSAQDDIEAGCAMRDALASYAEVERARLEKYEKASYALDVASLVFGAMTFQASPPIAALALLASVASFAANRAPLKHVIADVPFTAMTSSIRSRSS
jgi:hypothetical protein